MTNTAISATLFSAEETALTQSLFTIRIIQGVDSEAYVSCLRALVALPLVGRYGYTNRIHEVARMLGVSSLSIARQCG
jgi:hypothetical protein